MPTPVTFNRAVDRQQAFTFTMKIRDKSTGEYIDISTWDFQFLLKTLLDVTIWDVTSFTRADNYTISFTKSIAQVGAVTAGNYTISLLVTNTDMTANQYMTGTWSFANSIQ